MKDSRLPDIKHVRIDRIKIVNPRQRNAAVHEQIVENIRLVGLKRPITVTRRATFEEAFEYDLVCGQGRLEAYQRLGKDEIPAVVIDASPEDGLVMSLVENVARSSRTSLETMLEIKALRDRGHTHEAIAKVIGAVPSWVTGLLGLLERGEERLVASVASGTMPIALAVVIARDTSSELQRALAEAYESGALRGEQLAVVRRVIRLREKNKLISTSTSTAGCVRNWTPEKLKQIYEREAKSRRLAVMKADVVQRLTTFTIEAFKQLMDDEQFVAALRAEDLGEIPAALAREVESKAEG